MKNFVRMRIRLDKANKANDRFRNVSSRSLRYPRSSLTVTIREEGERFKCTYLTEIELSFARQRDENENGTGVYSLPAIKAQEVSLAHRDRTFNSRVVKYRHREYTSNLRITLISLESHRTATRRRRSGEGVKEENNRRADKY